MVLIGDNCAQRVGWSSAGEGHKRLAGWARCFAIQFHPRLACDLLGGVKVLWDVVPGSEVHLVGCLTAEGGVGEARVVLVHVEPDQLLEPAKEPSQNKVINGFTIVP